MVVLVGLLVCNWGGAEDQSRRAVTLSTIAKVNAALEEFLLNTDSTLPSLFIQETTAWGTPLRYESLPPHQSYRLWSDNPHMSDD